MFKSQQKYLLLILLAAFLLRLYHISGMSLRADEASNLFFASQDLGAIFKQLVTDDPHPPLYFLLLHFWIPVAGDSELALRFPGAFTATLTVALVYMLGRILFPLQQRVARIASAFAAINPSLIWDAQDAHLYPFLVLTSTASFAALLLALKRAAIRCWLPYVITSASALFFHYIAAFILIAQAAIALIGFRPGNFTKRALLSFIFADVIIAAIFLPWLLLAGNLLRGYQTNFFPPANLFDILARSLTAFSVGRVDDRLLTPMVEPRVGLIAALFFLAIFVFGLIHLHEDRTSLGILLAYLFVPFASFAIFSWIRFPIYDERYVLYLAPAFLLVLARGLNALVELPKARLLPSVTFLFVITTSAHSLYNYWYVPAFAKSPDWKGFVQQMISESKPGDVLIQNYPDPALPYYLQNRVPRVLLPRSDSSDPAALGADLTRLTTKYDRVWFQPAPNSTWDSDGLVAMWMTRHARTIRAYDFRGARLELYLTATSALRDSKSIGAIFDDRVQLIAYDLDRTKPLHLTLYWQAREKLNRDYTVFVHLYSSDGALIAQKDNAPENGTFPTSEWDASEIVVDSYDLDAPRGSYALMVGMYDSATQIRLNAVDAQRKSYSENRVPIALVTFQ